MRSIKKKNELPGLCYSDALVQTTIFAYSNFFLFDRTVQIDTYVSNKNNLN
jgi:hypothetical protein